jgi:hypothetical protein
LDEGPQGRRVGLPAEGRSLGEGERGRLDVGDDRLEVLVIIRSRLAAEVHGQDLLIELLGLGLEVRRVAAGTLLGQLEDDLDVRRVLGVAGREVAIGVDAGQRLLDLLQELVGRRAVADDPIDLVAVLVDEQLGRSGVDLVLLVDGVADLVAAGGAVEDDVRIEEFGVLGVVVELLDQQFAAPSATREEIDEDELVLFLGLGQRLVERSRHDLGRLGGRERGDEEEACDGGEFLHAVLPGMDILSDRIQLRADKRNPPLSTICTASPRRKLQAAVSLHIRPPDGPGP